MNILKNHQDAEETAYDVLYRFLKLTNSGNTGLIIKMVKHMAINRYNKNKRETRRESMIIYSLVTEVCYEKLEKENPEEIKEKLNRNFINEIPSYKEKDFIKEEEKKLYNDKLTAILEEEKNENKTTYDILLMKFFKDNNLTKKEHTLTEIGDVMGMSAEAVRRRLNRFFEKARKKLNEGAI